MESKQIWQVVFRVIVILFVMWTVLMAQSVVSQRYILSDTGQDTIDRAELQRYLDDISKRLQKGGN